MKVFISVVFITAEIAEICLVHLDSIGWAIWAAIKKYTLSKLDRMSRPHFIVQEDTGTDYTRTSN